MSALVPRCVNFVCACASKKFQTTIPPRLSRSHRNFSQSPAQFFPDQKAGVARVVPLCLCEALVLPAAAHR